LKFGHGNKKNSIFRRANHQCPKIAILSYLPATFTWRFPKKCPFWQHCGEILMIQFQLIFFELLDIED
jgi:hypothetical protein